MTHIQIPVDHIIVSLDPDAVEARSGEVDEPEGTAPPVNVDVSAERNSEFLILRVWAKMSLTLARKLMERAP